MRIVGLTAHRYDLPLRRPIGFSTGLLTTRTGIILTLTTSSGLVGRGEVAPLPGFSVESFAEAEAAVRSLAEEIVGRTVPVDPDEAGMWSDRVARWVWRLELPASVMAGLQAAIVDLVAVHRRETPAQTLHPDAASEVLVNGLLLGDADHVLADAARLRDCGFGAVKLKVGRGDLAEEARLVRSVRAALGPDVALRLDANRAWTEDDAARFARGVDGCGIAYIEEPLRDPSRLVSFSKRSGLPVALDETVSERAVEDLERWRGVRAVVLKPTLLGGCEFTLWMARRAINAGMTAVISACFESGVGTAGLACLAAALEQPDVPVGLDTYRWIAEDVVEASLDMSHGRLRTADAVEAMRAPLSAHARLMPLL